MAVIVLSDYLHKSHSAPIFSISGLVSISVILVTIFIPLLLVVMTHSKYQSFMNWSKYIIDYWIDTMKYFEQPSVKHLNELMVFMYTDDGVYSFGSTKNLND